MKKIIKQVPLVAFLLGLSFYSVKAMLKPNVVLTEQDWVLEDPDADPTNPANYVPYHGNLSEDCKGEEKICGIRAPEDGNTNMPQISTQLAQEITNEQPTSRVFLRPLL